MMLPPSTDEYDLDLGLEQYMEQKEELQEQQQLEHMLNPFFGGPSGGPGIMSGYHLGGPISLSMYSAGFDGFNASSSYSSGYRLSDSAGLIASNVLSPGYRSFESGGGLHLTMDVSRLFNLPANQILLFGLNGSFNYDETRYQASSLTPGGPNANAASENANTYSISGSVFYGVNNFYVSAGALFDLNHADITNNLFIPGAQGKTDGRGYALEATVGNLFPLVNTIGLSPATIVKAPPTSPGGYALLLDASGHYLYRQQYEDGFTDSTGFAYGTQQLSYNDVGARLRLEAVVPDRGVAWMPFVGATFDQELGLNYTFGIPAQAVTPADTLIISPSTTWWGAETGLNILTPGGLKFGMKAFYQASADTQTIGGSAYLKIPFEDLAPAADSGIRIAPVVGLPVKAPPPPPLPAYWNWAGLYIGGHIGGALSVTHFSDPFGSPIYGDQVRSPGFFGGGQIGYNWQAPGSRWVFGLEADGSLMDSDGTNTCFAVSSAITPSTCRARPEATSTLTGRVGYAFDPSGRTLIYGKAGLAWAGDKIGLVLDGATLVTGYNSQTVGMWGGTAGLGVERALSPAWSLMAEYDYVGLGRSNITNLGTAINAPAFAPGVPQITSVIPPGTSSVSQSFNEFKLGLNYKWGADPWASGWNSSPIAYLGKNPAASFVGWEVEGGGRYFGSWGQFQKNFGLTQSAGLPPLQNISRLTYDDLQTNSGEFFGRIEAPWNFFVKGYIGGGITNQGHMNDEDFSIVIFPSIGGYSNTLSPAVTGNIGYGTVDAGYDFLRGPGYKVGAFAGYFWFNQDMAAYGCTAIAWINCTPNPVPTSGSPVVTESDKWTAARIGISGETMLTDRIKISADVAWLPWVWLNSIDDHFVGNTGVLDEIISASGKGNGVQAEVSASYYLTPQWSVGAGARYWGMWTTPTGNLTFTFPPPATAPQYFKAQVEQLGAFVQTSYEFNWGG